MPNHIRASRRCAGECSVVHPDFLVAVAIGCGSKSKTFKPVVDPELVNLTKEQAFEKAEKS